MSPDIKNICDTCRRHAQRAKLSVQAEGHSFSETLSGCRVVVSIDGDRVRIREKKCGPKTKNGRSRYHGAWREPKQLIIHTVNAQGKTDKTFAPFIDATMKGPGAVFSMALFYLEKINVTEADKVLFVADGSVESVIRRVINPRLKGASLFWLKETAEAMLFLRSHYKFGRWNMLREHVFSLQAASVI
jgi:hypothetical protein